MEIKYRILKNCDKCGSENIYSETFSEIHGHRYVCRDCKYNCWGGRLKNAVKNGKRPPCPTWRDLEIDLCEMCRIKKADLPYAETLETHHKDGDPKNNDRLNLEILCSSCHSIVHHQRTYRGHFLMGRQYDDD